MLLPMICCDSAICMQATAPSPFACRVATLCNRRAAGDAGARPARGVHRILVYLWRHRLDARVAAARPPGPRGIGHQPRLRFCHHQRAIFLGRRHSLDPRANAFIPPLSPSTEPDPNPTTRPPDLNYRLPRLRVRHHRRAVPLGRRHPLDPHAHVTLTLTLNPKP